MQEQSNQAYRMSSYVRLFDIDERTVLVGHPFFLTFAVLEDEIAGILRALLEGPGTLAELYQRSGVRSELIERALKLFQAKHFVWTAEDAEEAAIEAHVRNLRRRKGVEVPGAGDNMALLDEARGYRDYSPVKPEALLARVPFEQLRAVKFLILGGCLTQFAADALEQSAPAFGIQAHVEVSWPDRLEALASQEAGVIVFQPSTTWFLGLLWDDGPFLEEEEYADRLQTLKHHLRLSLDKLKMRPQGSLLLVHGFSNPLYSPLGRTEFRRVHNFYRTVYELNQVIADAIREDPNALLIDEERLLSALGKAQLMDHALSTSSHHAPIDFSCGREPIGPSRQNTFFITQACRAPHVFAQAYLEAFLTWSGIGRIKCIILDLDNTLWPGVMGDEGFNISNTEAYQSFKYGVFGGIHQALKIVKQRGVLLAVCSRNNEADVQAVWAQLEQFATEQGLTHVLRREDFVIHTANWERKSGNIARIMEAVGAAPDATLFIDDNAVERAEVESVFPTLRTLGANLHLVRTALLDDPCLQNNMPTVESAARTRMVRAQLQRDAAREEASDEQTFLRTLNIQLNITRVRDISRLPRLAELIQRANQFNTTLIRLNAGELAQYIEDPCSAMYALEARDRFAFYGLVGVCLLRNGEITAFVLSCRIIPLRAAVPFLCAVLEHGKYSPVTATVVEGPRNQPCRQLYREAQFDELTPGRYRLAEPSQLPQIDAQIYRVVFTEESGKSG